MGSRTIYEVFFTAIELILACGTFLVGRHNKTWPLRRIVHMIMGGVLFLLIIIQLALTVEGGEKEDTSSLITAMVILFAVDFLTSASGLVLALFFYCRLAVSVSLREKIKWVHFIEGMGVILFIIIFGHTGVFLDGYYDQLPFLFFGVYPIVAFIILLFEYCCPKPVNVVPKGSDENLPLAAPLNENVDAIPPQKEFSRGKHSDDPAPGSINLPPEEEKEPIVEMSKRSKPHHQPQIEENEPPKEEKKGYIEEALKVPIDKQELPEEEKKQEILEEKIPKTEPLKEETSLDPPLQEKNEELPKEEPAQEEEKEVLPREESPKEEESKADEKKEEEKNKEKKPQITSALFKKLSKNIKQMISSKQSEAITEYRSKSENGKTIWTQTHFLFAIDCSGSMTGTRWSAVKKGYSICLEELAKMKDIRISAFTFDDNVNEYIRENTPTEALEKLKKIPFTKAGTNYTKALQKLVDIVEKSSPELSNYLNCIFFVSDGMGGFPENELRELKTLKDSGKKFLFHTIAIVTEEEDDMVKMTKEMEGDHYKVTDPNASQALFVKILGV